MHEQTLAALQGEIASHLSRGDFAAATATAATCRQYWPANAAGWLLGSFAALFDQRKQEALALVDEFLAVNPGHFECLLQRTECLFSLGRRDEALAAAAGAAKVAAANPAALDAVGETLVNTGEHAGARALYDRALAIAPRDVTILGKRAMLNVFLGDFAAAAADYDKVLELSPSDANALKGRAELERQTADRNSIDAMNAALARFAADSPEAATLHFALAKSYEDLGDHEANWRHLTIANRLDRRRVSYDRAQDAATIERIIEGFRWMQETPADPGGESPIFILGLPRTGTTLTDRILSSHSQVSSAGEPPALADAITAAVERRAPPGTLDWIGFAAALPDLDGPSIAADYLLRVKARRGDRPRFTDKQPANFFYCGLIFRAFPNARIVHVTRHPLAACYAIYKARFRERAYAFSYDLDELAAFYVAYRRLMSHWHAVLPGRILDVAYEDIVTALEPTTQRLLDYAGLPFEAACLDFHLNPSSTGTASAVQVRRPLYESSLQEWRHYETQLAPVKARLHAAGIAYD
jgi:tetratricopeptide (TPR) repeat protein